MDAWWIAILIKPLALLAFFGLIVLPIAWLLHKVIPRGRVRDVLYDRTLFQRKKWIPWLLVGCYFAVFVGLAVIGR